MNQTQRVTAFRQLHEQEGIFIMPNPWDVGSARILESMGFKALATTSAGFAYSLGVKDGQVTAQQVLDHCGALVNATDLPISADLEKGFGDSPEDVDATIHAAAEVGLAGASIEDHTGCAEDPIFAASLAVERIQAAVEVKQSLPNDFILTARCENFLWDKQDLDDTILRLQAFEKAGADVLYAPGLNDINMIKTLCSALTKPVNVVAEMSVAVPSLMALADAGVKRVSLGSKLFLQAYSSLYQTAQKMQEVGVFEFDSSTLDYSVFENIFES